MHTMQTHSQHLAAERGAMWRASAATVCTGSVAVAAQAFKANKVRTTIRPALAGGPAGGVP